MNAPDITAEELMEVQDSFSEELRNVILDRADRAAANWLFALGIPKTPADVRQLVHSIYKGGPALLIWEGHLGLSEGSKATAEERAKLKEQREQEANSFSALADKFFGSDSQNIGQGQYL